MKYYMITLVALLYSVSSYAQNKDQVPYDTCSFNIPNVVSPNSHNGEDFLFQIECNCPIEKLEFTIFNRWGAKIFETKDINMKWDFSEKATGTYYWSAKVKFEKHDEFEDTGSITVINK